MMAKLYAEDVHAESFDVLVECGLVPDDVSKAIVSLGYYGAVVTDDRIAAFNRGEPFVPPRYALRCDACDGVGETEYKTQEDLITAIREAAHGAYWRSPTEFRGDYANFSITGCTLSDAGVARSDGFCCVKSMTGETA